MDHDLSVYFYQWHDRKPLWKILENELEPDNKDYFLYEVWNQASLQLQINLENFLIGKNIDCELEFHIYHNIPAKWKKICFILCPSCKKSINIHLSRAVKYCPVCSNMKTNERRRKIRAIKIGHRLCKHCGKPLPKKYPNREYCCRSHQQMSWLNRKFSIQNYSEDGTTP